MRWIGVSLLAAIVVAGCVEPEESAQPTDVPVNSVDEDVSMTVPAQTDTDRIIHLPKDRYPTDAVFAGDRFWVIASTSPPESGGPPATNAYVLGVDVETGAVEVEVVLGDAPSRLVADEQAVWVTHWETGAVSRLAPDTGEVIDAISLELPFDFGGNQDNFLFVPFDIVLGHGSVWVSTARGAIARIDQSSAELLEMLDMPGNVLIGGLEVGPNGVWVEGDVDGLFHVSSTTGEFTNIPLQNLDHSASGVFIPGGAEGDTVYVSGDKLARTDDGDFRISDGGYILSGDSAVSRIDPETFEVLGSTEFDQQIIHLGWVNGFVGALDDQGVFTHLSSIPRLGSQINHTTFDGGYVFETSREGWEIDSAGSRLVRIDETGVAAIDLPFDIDDGAGARRPIPEEAAVSSDWEARDPAPIPHRWPAVMAWTGEEIVVWGGESLGGRSAVTGGAAYNVAGGTWREMSDSPLRGAREADWVWTGEELVIWTGPDGAAAWHPAFNLWRVIDGWPLAASFHQRSVWAGTEILSTGGFAVDPSNGDSRPIADTPELHERSSVVWVDGLMVSVTGDGAYHPDTDEWAEMGESPLTPLATSGVAVGDRLIAVDYEMNSAEYDPEDNVWLELPDLPLRFYECAPTAQLFRGRPVVDHCAGIAFWDEVDSMWMPVTHPEPTPELVPTIIAAGDRLFSWGTNLYEFVGDPEQPSRLSVGTSVLDVPDGWTVISVNGEAGVVDVVVESAEEEACTIVAAHVGAMGFLQSYMTDATTVTQVSPHVGGEPVDALGVDIGAIDDRYHMVWAAGTTDAIDLACTSQSGAEGFAPRVWSPYQ